MDPIAPNTSNLDVSTPVIDYNDLIRPRQGLRWWVLKIFTYFVLSTNLENKEFKFFQSWIDFDSSEIVDAFDDPFLKIKSVLSLEAVDLMLTEPLILRNVIHQTESSKPTALSQLQIMCEEMKVPLNVIGKIIFRFDFHFDP